YFEKFELTTASTKEKMGNILNYDAIFPITWLEAHTLEMLSSDISRQLELYRINERFNDCIITINGISTTLEIVDFEMAWWFKIPGDAKPTPWKYCFTGELLITNYPDLEKEWREEVVILQGLDVLTPFQVHQLENFHAQEYAQDLLKNYDFMSNYLKYNAIIPRRWLQVFSYDYVVTVITREVNRLIANTSEKRYNGKMIVIGTISAIIIIDDENRYWWFRIQSDVTRVPNSQSYIFTGNLFIELLLRGSQMSRHQEQMQQMQQLIQQQ
ncbi:hypothetical protein KQX54_001684, partial [Cotesia glomerata]